jgi:signal transduction histidine kinase
VRTRLLIGTILLTTATIVAFFVPTAISLNRTEREAQEVELQREAADAAALLGEHRAREEEQEHQAGESQTAEPPDQDHDRLAPEGAGEDHRFGLYDTRGALVLGDGPASADWAVRSALRGRSATGRVGEYRVATVPMVGGGAVRAAEPASEAAARTRGALLRLGLIGLAVLVVASIAAWLLARRLSRPLRDVGRSAARLGGGDFTATAPTSTGVAEVDEVATALNRSAARIGAMVERERRLTSDTSHQLRTPLAGLRLVLEGELASPRPERAEVIEEALGAVDRMEAIVDALTDLARDAEPGPPVELDDVARTAVDRWQALFEAENRELVAECRSSAVVGARSAALDTILDVLLDNALRHGRGVVTVATEAHARLARVVVTDEGQCVLPEEELFERRTSGSGGTGIGLHLARTLADAEGARLRLLEDEPTTFQLVLRALVEEPDADA